MSITITEIKRVFKFDDNGNTLTLDCPNVNLTPNEVRDLYAGQYPALTNATIEPKGIIDDVEVFEFNSILGTKG